MGVEFRISQFLSDAIFQFFGNEMFQRFSLLVYLIPGITKDLAKEKLHQTVPANDTKRPFPAFVGQARAAVFLIGDTRPFPSGQLLRSEEHTSELQSLRHLVCRLLLDKK